MNRHLHHLPTHSLDLNVELHLLELEEEETDDRHNCNYICQVKWNSSWNQTGELKSSQKPLKKQTDEMKS